MLPIHLASSKKGSRVYTPSRIMGPPKETLIQAGIVQKLRRISWKAELFFQRDEQLVKAEKAGQGGMAAGGYSASYSLGGVPV